jgi:hypothetical protein
MQKASFLSLGITICLLLSLAPLAAQTTTGSIVGTVTDVSGAAVPGAAVTVTNVDTNSATKTTTDSSGNYVVTPLAVGHYSVAVEAHGFKRSLSPGITLNVKWVSSPKRLKLPARRRPCRPIRLTSAR